MYDPLLGPDSATSYSHTQESIRGDRHQVQAVSPPASLPTVAKRPKKKSASAKQRQDRILAFYRDVGEAPLKDVMTQLPDVSEKTVRNDLSELVRQGALERRGRAPTFPDALR